MIDRLNNKPALIAIPALSVLLLMHIHAFFNRNTLGMGLFNTIASVIILVVSLSVSIKMELNYYLVKSRLKDNVQRLRNFLLPLSILNTYYKVDSTREELRFFIEKCENAKEIKEMVTLSIEAEKMWPKTFAMIGCYHEAFTPRYSNIDHEFIAKHIYNVMR